MKQITIPIISVLIGILAFWLSSQYLQRKLNELEQAKQALRDSQQMVWIVVARHQIPVGTVLKKSDLAKKPIPRAAVSRSQIMPDDAHFVFGKKTLYSLQKADPLQWTDVDIPYRPHSGLASMITPPVTSDTPSMRALSISVSGASGVSGLVQPNDHIDVLGTFSFPTDDGSGELETATITILQDVTVLATGQRLGNQAQPSNNQRRTAAGYNTVTLEVTPREAELLVFAEQTQGHLTLSLRNPDDVRYEESLPSVNFKHLESKIPLYNSVRQKQIRHKRDL
jgi:pilus assembly protein CpaB